MDGHEAKLLGELGSIGLTDIFETLGNKQRYGWLSLRNEEEEVILYFQGDLVGLVTPPEKKLSFIPAKLHHAGALSYEQYQTIIASETPLQELEQRTDGSFLLTVLNTIYYDEICRLFSWTSGYFEFIDQQTTGSDGKWEPVGNLFESESIVMEAARRFDEYVEIYRSLPGNEEFLIRNADPGSEMPPLDDPMGNVWNLANYRNVQEIIDLSYLSEFDAAKILTSFYEHGEIRILSIDELKEQAKLYNDEGDLINAAKYYHLVLQRSPFDLIACDALVTCYESSEDESALAELYRKMANNLFSSKNSEHIVQGAYYLKKFSDTQYELPEGIEARLRLLRMTVNHQIDPKVIDYNPIVDGKWLFQSLRRKKDDEAAKEVLQMLLQLTPHNKTLQSELINVYLDLGDNESAVAQYEVMAKIYEKENNLAELEETYQKITKLTPSRKDIVQKLDKIVWRRRRKKLALGKITAVVASIIIVIGGGYWFQQYSAERKKRHDAFYREIDGLLANHQLKEAKERIKSSSWLSEGEIVELEQKLSKYQLQINEKARLLIDESLAFEEEGNLSEAKKTLQKIREGPIPLDIQSEVLRHLQRVSKSLEEFYDKLEAAQRLERQERYDDAVSAYRNIWNSPKYRNMKERNGIRFPVRFSVFPVGASITMDEGQPIILSESNILVYCSPNFKRISIELRGYAPYILYNAYNRISPRVEKGVNGETLNPLHSGEIKIQLQKDKLWIHPINVESEEPIDASPLYINGVAYVACRDSHVYAITDLDKNPKTLWGKLISRLASFSTTPSYHKGILYIGGNDGKFYAISAKDGKIVDEIQIGGLLKSSSAIARLSSRTTVVVFGAGTQIYALPVIKGRRRWGEPRRLRIDTRKEIVSPIIVEGGLALVSHTKYLYAFDLRRNKRRWHYTGNSRISPPAIYQSQVYFGGNGSFYCVSLTTGTKIWQQEISGSVESQPLVTEKGVYFGTTTGDVYSLRLDDGKVQWQSKVKKALRLSPVMNERGILYIASKDEIFALDSKKEGSIYWQYSTEDKGDINTSPLLIEGVLVVAVKGSLYGFTDN